jgi:hypothetical protein
MNAREENLTAALDLERTIAHVVSAIGAAPESDVPFRHLRIANVFPADVYAAMLEAMPEARDYRRMSGRARTAKVTRTKIDLFPECIRHLPKAKRGVWDLVGEALCSEPVREAWKKRLAAGLERRFGAEYGAVGMYPVPILTRDIAGYKIGVHPDTRWKGMTIQLYLPRDESIAHVGTIFHRKVGDKKYEVAQRMAFSPNTGYAFAVAPDTYHSVDVVGPEVNTRDSILLTYFVDQTFMQKTQNRWKRFANSMRASAQAIGRMRA